MTQEEARRVMEEKYPGRVFSVDSELWSHGDGRTSETERIMLFAKDYVYGMENPCEQYEGEHYPAIIAKIDEEESK